MIPLAHGIGGVRDLPVPESVFMWGAAIVLVLSFLALGVLWREPLLERHRAGRPVAWLTSLARILRVPAQVVSVAFLVVVFVAALLGDKDAGKNIAPTWIYVVFWLGLPLLSVLLGDVWRALSPWRAIADGFVWMRERGGAEVEPLSTYPERLGRWPGVVALFLFVALELTYTEPSNPRVLAAAIAIYSYATLVGMAAYGREIWTKRGEGFALLFGYLARMAPLHVREGRVALRWPLTGLAGAERVPGSTAFVAAMLGSVAFDGFSRTRGWQNLVADVRTPFLDESRWVGDVLITGVGLAGLVALIVVVALAFVGACRAARWLVSAPRPLEPEFLLSLVPIAFVYVVAHYFSLFVLQGQYVLPMLSDPLGRGWDLFGTAGIEPNQGVLTPNTIWYVQAAALVLGHVAGLAVAHDRAVALFPERRAALRSQYAMLGLMVLYTVGGLWLLSRG